MDAVDWETTLLDTQVDNECGQIAPSPPAPTPPAGSFTQEFRQLLEIDSTQSKDFKDGRGGSVPDHNEIMGLPSGSFTQAFRQLLTEETNRGRSVADGTLTLTQ